jgi:hypothetical protein
LKEAPFATGFARHASLAHVEMQMQELILEMTVLSHGIHASEAVSEAVEMAIAMEQAIATAQAAHKIFQPALYAQLAEL